MSYQVIEIKIFENFTNKLIGREIFTYTDIFGIFENYFLCFNEDMLNIYTSLKKNIKQMSMKIQNKLILNY